MSKHRRFQVQTAANANSDINITPLVDVVLVLLIIFMTITPLLEKDILVRVPSTEKVETVTEVPPDQMLIRIMRNNELKLNGTPVDINELVNKLRPMLANKKPEDKVVFVSPEDESNYGRLITVLDRAKEAGAEALGMTTEPPPPEEPAAP
ncbi:MAG: biopolymer transporter ExbD [Polyangiaceae bacterium]|jgi:biopolymer transport protein ExbD|nr:biopolymer transporter ExbD [Polyangiaceae bacterium]